MYSLSLLRQQFWCSSLSLVISIPQFQSVTTITNIINLLIVLVIGLYSYLNSTAKVNPAIALPLITGLFGYLHLFYLSSKNRNFPKLSVYKRCYLFIWNLTSLILLPSAPLPSPSFQSSEAVLGVTTAIASHWMSLRLSPFVYCMLRVTWPCSQTLYTNSASHHLMYLYTYTSRLLQTQ